MIVTEPVFELKVHEKLTLSLYNIILNRTSFYICAEIYFSKDQSLYIYLEYISCAAGDFRKIHETGNKIYGSQKVLFHMGFETTALGA